MSGAGARGPSGRSDFAGARGRHRRHRGADRSVRFVTTVPQADGRGRRPGPRRRGHDPHLANARQSADRARARVETRPRCERRRALTPDSTLDVLVMAAAWRPAAAWPIARSRRSGCNSPPDLLARPPSRCVPAWRPQRACPWSASPPRQAR
jgi:hypothetical protein